MSAYIALPVGHELTAVGDTVANHDTLEVDGLLASSFELPVVVHNGAKFC